MPTVPALIDHIRQLYGTQLPPAGATQLARAEQVFRHEFGIEMPPGYRALLQTVDGVAFNGVLFYSTQDAVTTKGAARFGLGEANERLIRGREVVETTLRFVGETGDQLFAYDTAERNWKVVDRIDWETTNGEGVFASFEALFRAQFDRFVDW